MARRLGQLETAALAYVQMRSMRTVTTGDVADALRITAKQERELLSRMMRAQLIARVRNGLYVFPPKLPLGGIWTPGEATAINILMTDARSRYQITGLAAFNRYGFDEQIPSRIEIYNEAMSGERNIGGVALTLIKVEPDRLGHTELARTTSRETPSGETLIYSSRVRALVDAVYDWTRFDSLPRAYDWIRRDLEAGRITASALATTAVRYGNAGTVRRIGALLEHMNVDERILRRLERAIAPSTAKIPSVPTRPTRGTLRRRWGVVANA